MIIFAYIILIAGSLFIGTVIYLILAPAKEVERDWMPIDISNEITRIEQDAEIRIMVLRNKGRRIMEERAKAKASQEKEDRTNCACKRCGARFQQSTYLIGERWGRGAEYCNSCHDSIFYPQPVEVEKIPHTTRPIKRTIKPEDQWLLDAEDGPF